MSPRSLFSNAWSVSTQTKVVAHVDKDRRSKFERVFAHYELVHGFARNRGSLDPESITAETMTIAWRRIDELNVGNCRPWLVATARNLLIAEYRKTREISVDPGDVQDLKTFEPDFEVDSLEPAIDFALRTLEPIDREALLLIAWDELSPKEAAASLEISSPAFRVRLHRARKRFIALLDQPETLTPATRLSKERT